MTPHVPWVTVAAEADRWIFILPSSEFCVINNNFILGTRRFLHLSFVHARLIVLYSVANNHILVKVTTTSSHKFINQKIYYLILYVIIVCE